jgi:ribulose-phosphate 3-epimerase
MRLVAPAVLPASLTDFKEKLAHLGLLKEVSQIQIDVVDGRFASPMSWPYTALQELRAMVSGSEMLPHLERVTYEIDLMCLDPERAAEAWLTLGASRLTFHAESLVDIGASLDRARARFGDVSATFGLALNIASDISLIERYLEHIEYVQIMGIATIGKQGQPFDRRALEKVRALRTSHPDLPIQVDGGVTLEVAKELVSAGVTTLVVGSAILRAKNPAAEIEKFESLQTPFGV